MKKVLLNSFCLSLLLLFLSFTVFSQGVTTAAMNGKVTDVNGEPLPGATVVAVHTSSGSTYGNVTDLSGFFRIPNMRVGGPYKVTVSFVGYDSFEREDVYLTLGQ
ncbi:MAG: carboxypeptidase-like regulatory domain-containing protein, partial [Cyclobacteriaceae bacterium]